MFQLHQPSMYLGEHEKTSHSHAILIEFMHCMRTTGLQRDYDSFYTYNRYGSFTATTSQILIARIAMMSHPSINHNELMLPDQERQ